MFMERLFQILQPNSKLLNKFEVIPTKISKSLKIFLKRRKQQRHTLPDSKTS